MPVRLLAIVLAALAVAAAGIWLGVGQAREPTAQPSLTVSQHASPDPTATPTASATTTVAPTPSEAEPEPEDAQARPLLLPALISARPPTNFCGHDSVVRTIRGDIGHPAPWECLLAALEVGGSAELIRDSLTIEGGPIRSIVRVGPSGAIELWHDGTRDPFGSRTWTRQLCGRIETFQPDPSAAAAHDPDDCGAEEVVIGMGDESQPSGDEMAMLEALVLFARTGEAHHLARVPLSADGVWLGLADQLTVQLSPDELVQPDAWRIEAEAFRGFVGPFSPLDQLAAWGPQSDRPFVREASVTVGPHSHCASPPVPAPQDVAGLRRLSIQPIGEVACLAWWTVDFFVEPNGDIVAITLDRYEP
jgi:hypothetical protein